MIELKNGQRVPLEIGGYCTVKKELGRGGQGIVYLVNLNGKDMALKWYMSIPSESFYKNMQKLKDRKPRLDAFIWPLYLTKRRDGQFGYVMDLRPDGYFEFGQYMLAHQQFSNFYAMINAAIKICEGFRYLHLDGFSYQDLNDGNFFIRPSDGDILICDNDNVSPYGTLSGIKGKMRYMAPEIVKGGSPDKYSDRFSLSVVLFILFYLNHPFEGLKVAERPVITEELEQKLYGDEIEFLFSPQGNNRPKKGVHTNVLKRWKPFPTKLSNFFMEEFSDRKLKNPTERTIETDWQKLLIALRDETVVCPHCGNVTFLDIENQKDKCIFCEKQIDTSHKIKINNRSIILTPKSRVYLGEDTSPDAVVAISPKDKSVLTLTNVSNDQWSVETPSGKIRPLGTNETMPVLNGMKITCRQGKGEIIITK